MPTYASIGIAAPLLLALCRCGQGIGLGGEWGGAVLLATENAPPGKRAWFGMFPQLGAPIGFFFSGGVFLLLSRLLTNAQFFAFGWRLPFLSSALLVFLGLYVRLTLTETPEFEQALARGEQVRVPIFTVLRDHTRALTAGVLLGLATFVLFYLMSVFALSWGTSALGFSRNLFLRMQLLCVPFLALTIPISALLSKRFGGNRVMLWATAGIFLFGFALAPMFTAGIVGTIGMLTVGFILMGFTYGPIGTVLAELFPTAVRYTGSSIAFSFAGILGASVAPYIATSLAKTYSLPYVGYYLSAMSVLSFLGLLLARPIPVATLTNADPDPIL